MTPEDRAIVRDAAGIAVAVGAYAVSFGVLAVAAGASTLQAVALSSLVFTGASQFAFIGVLAGGGTAAAAMAPALVLAVRNMVYGMAVSPLIRGGRLRRALLSHLVIDESTAMAQAQPDPERARVAFVATGVGIFVCWNGGTLLGALLGDVIGDPADLGLDAMFPAAFLALLAPQLRRPGAVPAAVTGGLLALALVPFTPAGVPIIAAVLGLVPAARAVRRR